MAREAKIFSAGANVTRKGQVNHWDKFIKVERDGYVVREPNPNYSASDSRMASAPQSLLETQKTPPLKERIIASLAWHESVNEDSLAVVTDNPTSKAGSIDVPDESQNVPYSGVVILLGKEAAEKGPPGLALGRRVTYSMMAGTGFPFAKKWEMRILRHSEVKSILRDKSGIRAFNEALLEMGKANKK